MDPMDYTMESGETSPQSAPNPGFPCHQAASQLPPTASPFVPGAREYDPVRDTTSNRWHQPSSSSTQSRPYTVQPNLTLWGPPYNPISSWQNPSSASQSGFGQPDTPSFQHSIESGGPLPFGFPYYTTFHDSHSATAGGMLGARNTNYLPSVSGSRRQWGATLLGHDSTSHSRPQNPGLQPNPALRQASNISFHQETEVRPAEANMTATNPLQTSPASHRSSSTAELRLDVSREALYQATESNNSQAARIQMRAMRPGFAQSIRGSSSSHSRRRRHGPASGGDEGEVILDPPQTFRRSDYLFDPEDDERTFALMRGAVAGTKRVPSKSAIASLIPMSIEEVRAEEQGASCNICYNDYGVPNPEGVVESPIKLPNCKHIFGDICIKKWFEDSDTCPYCRDKLPSESSARKPAQLETIRAARDRLMNTTHRPRHVLLPHYSAELFTFDRATSTAGTSLDLIRDGYSGAPHRGADWDHIYSGRPPTFDEFPRRASHRSRMGSARSVHIPGHPTSVGSPAFVSRISQHTTSQAQRAVMLSVSPGNHSDNTGHRRDTVRAAMPRGSPPGSNTTPPRSRRFPVISSSPDETSPPVAVGSIPAGRGSHIGRSYFADFLRLQSIHSGYHTESSRHWTTVFESPDASSINAGSQPPQASLGISSHTAVPTSPGLQRANSSGSSSIDTNPFSNDELRYLEQEGLSLHSNASSAWSR